jgi:ATP/maltotriose-dependent transcriptional regulator MalT
LAYVDRLLCAFPAPVPEESKAPSAGLPRSLLAEPLTARELEVLQLIAVGLSNKEIAARLVVTVGTVKAHSAAIYRKLDAPGRTRAVAIARELHML